MITENAQFIKRLPSWLYKIAAQLYIDKRWPRHIFLETTASCNLRCEYCPREKNNSHMDFNLFKSIIDEASHYGPRSFSLHLFGEPLLYPKWREAIRYIKEKNKRNTVLFTSNGTLFERTIDDLLISGVDKVLWTYRPEAKWSEETIKKLKKWNAFTVRLISEVTPPEIYKEFSKWPRVETRRLHNYGGEIKLISSKLTSSVTSIKRWPCYHLWLAPAVAWNGNLLICCADSHQKEVRGHFPEKSVSNMWQELKAIRQSHLSGKYEGICRECDVWKQYPDIFFKFQHS